MVKFEIMQIQVGSKSYSVEGGFVIKPFAPLGVTISKNGRTILVHTEDIKKGSVVLGEVLVQHSKYGSCIPVNLTHGAIYPSIKAVCDITGYAEPSVRNAVNGYQKLAGCNWGKLEGKYVDEYCRTGKVVDKGFVDYSIVYDLKD